MGDLRLLPYRLRKRIQDSQSGMTDEIVVMPGGRGFIDGMRAIFVAGDA
jgi:uncharacterized Rossmann fold enzyme